MAAEAAGAAPPELRRLRGARSVRALAGEVGCTPEAVRHWEQGRRRPTPRLAGRYAAALGLTPAQLAALLGDRGPGGGGGRGAPRRGRPGRDRVAARRGRRAAAVAVGAPHFDAAGRAVMVDVGGKRVTQRVAVARGAVTLSPEAFERVRTGTAGKGDVLGVARVAGILGAKRASDLVPLCHPLPLSSVQVRFRLVPPRVEIEAEVRCVGRTGAEMEALTAVAAAGLAVYDMCKAYARGAVLGEVRLVRKAGGRSGSWQREGEAPWPETEVR